MLYWYMVRVGCSNRDIREYCCQLYFDLTHTDGFKDYSRSTQATYDYYHNKIKELSRITPGVHIAIDYRITVDEDAIDMIHTIEYLNGEDRETGIRPEEATREPINEIPY